MNMPWVVFGDLNEILFSSEKEGGATRPQAYMQAFRECLVDCSLEDLGYIGNKFTWKRGRLRERLDRAVGNAAWSAFFPDASVHNLAMIGSDHRPILLDTNTYTAAELILNRRRRRFEGKWLREEKVREGGIHSLGACASPCICCG
jgi:endonuclease/exonuclease/phosphatase family metal-dependent hydrolase